MRKLMMVVSLTALWVGSAFAQDKEKKAAPPGMPKPAPEMQEYKSMIGTWKCTGKGTMGGQEMKSTGTFKAAWDLDGAVVVARYDEKMAGMPGTHKGMTVYSYDPTEKMFVSTSYSSMGGGGQAKSKGWEGDKQDWTGKMSMMGQNMDVKFTVTKKGDREVAITGTFGPDSYEQTCKK